MRNWPYVTHYIGTPQAILCVTVRLVTHNYPITITITVTVTRRDSMSDFITAVAALGVVVIAAAALRAIGVL